MHNTQSFVRFRDIHKGRAAVIMCSGATLAQYEAPEPGLIVCGVNSVALHGPPLDYLFLQDPGHAHNPDAYVSRPAAYDAYTPAIAKFYGDNCAVLRDAAAEAHAESYTYAAGPIVVRGNARIEDPRYHGQFRRTFDGDSLPWAAGSVTFVALQFLLHTGVSRIYIAGADITRAQRVGELPDTNPNDYVDQNFIGRWQEFRDWAAVHCPDVEFRVVNPVGLRGMFPTATPQPAVLGPVPGALSHSLEGLRFHLQGLPRIPTRFEFAPCAYTGKIIRLAKMLRSVGGHVTFYGVEGSEVECDEFVPALSAAEWQQLYGAEHAANPFYIFDRSHPGSVRFDERVIAGVRARMRPRDFLLCPVGNYHKRVIDAVPLMSVDSGIGYTGIGGKFRVFESDVWRHHVYGLIKREHGAAYDTVIPNVYEPGEFAFEPAKEDYYLYVGRLIQAKGVGVAADAVREVGGTLVVAGPGQLSNLGLHKAPHVEYVGVADRKTVARLMGKAKAVFTPTQYLEPFGGTAVEAQLCGTPVITSNYGAFVETVDHGVTGFRCDLLRDYVRAAQSLALIRPEACRAWAASRYTTDQGTPRYAEYFQRLLTLWGKGWYTLS